MQNLPQRKGNRELQRPRHSALQPCIYDAQHSARSGLSSSPSVSLLSRRRRAQGQPQGSGYLDGRERPRQLFTQRTDLADRAEKREPAVSVPPLLELERRSLRTTKLWRQQRTGKRLIEKTALRRVSLSSETPGASQHNASEAATLPSASLSSTSRRPEGPIGVH